MTELKFESPKMLARYVCEYEFDAIQLHLIEQDEKWRSDNDDILDKIYDMAFDILIEIGTNFPIYLDYEKNKAKVLESLFNRI